ncbi:PilC/PilY family type IV pilus protein [Stenotrophomonas koreensis]|uniref:pilus assembly protein n=1 Tax=Stenotrophomonas koreensis TaxID=266128 RepID=UPI003397D52A
MNTHKSRLSVSIGHLLATGLLTVVSGAGHATSFPNYPLMTGGTAIPPNILLIMDDSGSMEFPRVKLDGSGESAVRLEDNVSDRSSVNNLLFYDPGKTYLPWRNHNINEATGRLAAASFTAVRESPTSAQSGDTKNLESSGNRWDAVVYYPKPGVQAPGVDASNYYRYYLNRVGGSGSYVYGRDIVESKHFQIASGLSRTVSGKNNFESTDYYRFSDVSNLLSALGNGSTVTARAKAAVGSDTYTLQVIDTTYYGYWYEVCSAYSNSLEASCSFTYDSDRNYAARLFVQSGNNGKSRSFTGAGISVNFDQQTFIAETPTGRSQADEKQNFANWYTYHRTRSKMAKAGAAEAFGRLGRNYRVGYDSIWNRNGSSSGSPDGSLPSMPIPSGDGLFEGNNRKDFYDRLFAANANDGTPLRGALQRAGRYFSSPEPYRDASNSELSCRQNYSILTTDGYWNSNDGYTSTPSIGNADGVASHPYRDDHSTTLADIAYYFWNTDLRPYLANNVRPTPGNPKTHQHMVTFGVSLGLSGTLNRNNPPPSPWSVNAMDQTGSWNGRNINNNYNPRRIDDLWHAALNGRGDFFVASDTERFASSLESALRTIDARAASGSNVSSSSTKTESSTLTFVAGFTSGSWIGEMTASPFNAALTGVSSTPQWRLSKTFQSGGVNATGFKNRAVVTSLGGAADIFDGNLPAGVTSQFARTGGVSPVTAEQNIAYLRGDQSLEQSGQAGGLRKRGYPMGDIVNSSPAYLEDNKMLFIGANDGMLHGLDSETGKVLLSYVPKGVDVTALAGLSSIDYDHRYFVDGQIDVTRKSLTPGKNILVAAMGRGGRGVFALDVTGARNSFGKNAVLWDHTTTNPTSDPDMGYVLGALRIRKGNGDRTYAFVPNGIDSHNGSAALYVYDMSSSFSAPTVHKLVVDNTGGNGLMSLGVADLNADGKVDLVYGGDLKGNVWRWDFSGDAPPTTATKLFQALDPNGSPQPITGGIAVGRSADGEVFVGFGTGRFISNSDVPVVGQLGQTQSIYGLKDAETTILGRQALQERTIPLTGTTSTGKAARGFEPYSALPNNKRGWYLDLSAPERVITAPTVYGSAMYLTSAIPADSSDCTGATGSGFINAINMFTGTSPASGGYFSTGGLTGGVVGSIGVSGGMPTEVNLTNTLVTVGTGAGLVEGFSGTDSEEVPPPSGGVPSRVSWREILP